MQSEEMCGGKKMVKSHEKNKVQTARKSFKKPPLKGHQSLQGASIPCKILRFRCSECKGDATFSPNDLTKHFQGVHQGSLPTFPCDMCGFITHDFSSLQRHRLGHRDTFVRCEICNDGVQYTLLQLTRHFTMYHSLNGHYRCERCKFSTKDVGTFVQHIHHHNEVQYKCSKCKHVSYTKGEFQKHLLVHTGTYPFTCQFCDYGATRKDYIIRHMASVHSKEKKNKWRVKEENPKTLVKSPGLKLLLTKKPTRETWMSKRLHALSGSNLLDDYGRLPNPEKTLEETQQFLERTVAAEKESKNWIKGLNTEQQYVSQAIPTLSQPKTEGAVPPNAGFLNPGSNGLTVLMVKNKISIPPNCTTKVMGFKIVDGKKHLVLKVIPSAKQESSPKVDASPADVKETERRTSETRMDGNSSDVVVDGTVHNRNQASSSNYDDSTRSASSAFSESLTARKMSENGNVALTSPKEVGDEGVEGQPSNTVETEKCRELKTSTGENENEESPLLGTFASVHKSGSVCDKAECASQSSSEEASQVKGAALQDIVNNHGDKYINVEDMQPSHDSPLNDASVSESNSGSTSVSQEVFSFHNYSKDTYSCSPDMSSPGKDQGFTELLMNGPEPDSAHMLSLVDRNRTPEDLSGLNSEECHEDEGSEHLPFNSGPLMEKVPDSEIEVDECIATVEEECNGISLFPDLVQRPHSTPKCTPRNEEQQPFALGKGKEKDTSVSDSACEHQNCTPEKKLDVSLMQKVTGSACRAAALGRILEEHSDAIISQQLEKERNGATVAHDALRSPSTSLRILQSFNVAEGKQQVFLQTAENKYAVPVEQQGTPGFKMITGSSVPPINISYLKPGTERPGNKPAALAFTLKNGRIGKATQVVGGKEAGGGLVKGGREESKALSSVHQGMSSSSGSSHVLVNSSPLKGPLLLSSPAQTLSRERTVNASACFLVQRPLPVVATVARPGGEAISHGLQNEGVRPVLAVPINSQDQATILQAGRQAFLLRYVSPLKSGIPLNSQEGNVTNQSCLQNESIGNKVVFKIVKSPSDSCPPCGSGEPNSNVATHAAANQPIYLATGALQSPCFLMSSNQSIMTVSTGVKTSGSSRVPMHVPVTVPQLKNLSSSAPLQGKTGEKEGLNNKLKRVRLPAPRSNHQPVKRKRQRKSQTDDCLEPASKAKRHSSKKCREKEFSPAAAPWEPVPREAERMLRLSPFCPAQLIKCPRRNQPVIVLNHPDVDIPEVSNIMRMVNKYKGEVLKVALSQRTVDALSELNCGTFKTSPPAPCQSTHGQRVQSESTARERFILKLKLKKTSRNKYKVVNTTSDSAEQSLSFSCWFCGRIFDNQEEWIGHGQRHLMEATRDWNKLF
ncbi:zinc finger protein 518A-like [Scleropages formosus]|uniref:Zinc finger protein 518A n=1 Tax=Scleropages formosus TaxID=113540 RepID=A0A0P7VC23_SCLFO|nr:zinc finger protein 518A-like [Scleropages formosus]